MEKIRIIADNKIPFLKGVLDNAAEVIYLHPSEINADVVRDADALIIRTRTKCDEKLLAGSKVKFIATATIGHDHIDKEYCSKNSIKWVNAPGCNSSSVMQYVASALVTLANQNNFELKNKTLGIVGVGNVGSKVQKFAETIGMNVVLCDPPRKENESLPHFVTLDELITKSDIITFHVPLNKSGEHKTYHLGNEEFFAKVRKNTIIINSSRGEVLETAALKNAIKTGKLSAAVLDVWENEPDIDTELLNLTDIATPHIAGYSADGKANGTSVCVKAAAEFFGLKEFTEWYPEKLPDVSSGDIINTDCSEKSEEEILYKIITTTYDIKEDDKRLKNTFTEFENQRNNYPVRREFPYFRINLTNGNPQITKILEQLNFKK